MLPKALCFVDTETTGMRSFYDRIIEIGILRYEDGKLTKTFQSLINPDCYIPNEITGLTGISAKDLENSPSFRQIKDEISDILENALFVAHNVRFDYSFLKNEFKRVGMEFSPKQLCSVKLARTLYPSLRRHNLDSIIEHFNISCPMRHRAFDDARVLFEFYKIIQKTIDPELLQNAFKKILKKPSIPIKLDRKVLDSLPQNSGVYIFYGSDGIPLYIGKSINIKERVLSHFSSDLTSPLEMKISQQIESIETHVTAGELGALLLESALIKKFQPLYNRMLRIKKKLVALKSYINKQGYKSIILETVDSIQVEDLEGLLGVFKSKKQAKDIMVGLAKEHGLCEKLLGLESGEGECFGNRLGKCKGACLNRELPIRYNIRFIEAFGKNKIKPWPFKGPILIKEYSEIEDKEEAFLIDKWCYLGRWEAASSTESKAEFDYLFDIDTYKILERYLNSPLNLKNISALKC